MRLINRCALYMKKDLFIVTVSYNPVRLMVQKICYFNFDLIQWWTEIIMQLRVLPQILSQLLTNIHNAKKKRNKWHKKKLFFTVFRLVMQVLLQDMTRNVFN